MSGTRIPCPFVYASGKRCTGHIVRVEAFKADLSWSLGADGSWSLEIGPPRSHFHLWCSEKGNHAGVRRQDALRYHYRHLPEELQTVIDEAPLAR